MMCADADVRMGGAEGKGQPDAEGTGVKITNFLWTSLMDGPLSSKIDKQTTRK